jgi:glutathione peroxidase
MKGDEMTVYQFVAKAIDGQEMSLQQYAGKVLLIVNTASKCGFTPQYEELQELYDLYKNEGFSILGFPCNQFMNQEPGNDGEIQSFCELNYKITFPMFAKVDVKGPNAHPLFIYLSEKAPGLLGSKNIKWNFTKFLIDAKGEVVNRYAPSTKPKEIENDIKKLL